MYNWMQKQWNKHRRKMQTGEGGFTLVELVVVIAIMGILAGAGSVGYTGYIKSAAKKADLATVSNIQRAIETGVFSKAFLLDEKLQIAESGIKVPVGFIMLNKEGTSALESNTATTCKIETATVNAWSGQSYKDGGFLGMGGTTVYVYEPSKQISYCSTCSDFDPDAHMSGDLNFSTSHGSSDYSKKDNVCNIKDMVFYSDHIEGKDSGQYSSHYTTTNSGALAEVLKAAYGESYSSIRLQSDEWTVSNIPSFYEGGAETWGQVESLANTFKSYEGLLKGLGWINDHEGTDGLIKDVAIEIAGKKDAFLAGWEEIDNSGDASSLHSGASFGMTVKTSKGEAAKEYYVACRKMYNSAFTSYLRAQNVHASEEVEEAHALKIDNFNDKLAGVIDTLPQTICKSAFKSPDSVLDASVKGCSVCYDAYCRYVDSGMSTENAEAVFDTMNTIKETGDVASASGDFFGYYERYLGEFNSLYSKVNAKAKEGSCIVITVFQKGDEIIYDISPTDADPSIQ